MQSGRETIVIVGYGWVGQANALALTRMGHEVFYYDIAPPVLRYADKHAELYERIKPLGEVLEKDGENTWYIVAVGDRVLEDGSQDITLIKKTLDALKPARGRIILRSTVLSQNLEKLNFDFYVPEFLHERHAVEECLNPYYFVLGKRGNIDEPNFLMDWRLRAKKVFKGTPKQASYIKYLSNLWNAARVAFINEFGDLARDEAVIDFVFEKKNYLRYGQAFGGHCLPKDLLAFWSAHAADKNVELLRAAYLSNELHKKSEAEQGPLPEWFSSWEEERRALGEMRTGAFLWNKFNLAPPVQAARRRLRFLVNIASRLTPKRSLGNVKEIWNDLARKNARYFTNTKTPSGRDVNEFELRETGLADYEKYVAEDTLLAPVLRNPPAGPDGTVGAGGQNQSSVLEVGCGLGRMTEFFPRHFAKTSAIDISDIMVESAKKRVADAKNIDFKISDGKTIAFPDNHFNLVFSYQTLQHIPAREILAEKFTEIYRTLKPGGMAKLHLRTGRGPYKWHWAYGVSVTPVETKGLAETAGFKFIKHEIENPKSLWVWLAK
ncbi:MAG: methyltransferase domain-containing protein [Candidatus Giovannonibacteria bacterium]|nr:MAG: methyltransferase domain-containing protein [Candidatus Giovannonibacteria bacterium]